ncbi:MAG: kelch motif-containing protein, partial [Thermoplasmata archaeon]|nr:kelch motif-containing protein [Thermoplasmata archaeon]
MSGSTPAARWSMSMAYDPPDGFVLMYGGFWFSINGPPGPQCFRETWGFANGSWFRLNPATSPPGLTGATLAYYPPADVMVMMGGWGPNGYSSIRWCFSNKTYLHPTGWYNCTQTHGSGPSPRAQFGMAYDAADSALVLYGGFGSDGAILGDTWIFSGTDLTAGWTSLSFPPLSRPAARFNFSMVYESEGSMIILTGGMPSLPGSGTFNGSNSKYWGFNDTWSFKGLVWNSITLLTARPSPRQGAAGTYDGMDGYMLLYGGAICLIKNPLGPSCSTVVWPPASDTWTFAGNSWTYRHPFPAPPPLYAAGMAYDERDGYVVMFGGNGPAPAAGNYTGLTWIYWAGGWSPLGAYRSPTLAGWNNVSTAQVLSHRIAAGMAYDPDTNSVVLFGGYYMYTNGQGQTTTIYSETWTYARGQWKNLSLTTHPSYRQGESMAYDALDNYIVLFGGCDTLASPGTPCHYLGDTWKFQSGAWSNITSSQSQSPSSRTGAATTYEYAYGRVVLFGGVGVGGLDSDTWGFHQGQWLLLVPSSGTHPAGRTNSSLSYFDAYDGAAQETCTFCSGFYTIPKQIPGYDALLGGYNASGSPVTFYNDTWELNGSSWTLLSVSTAPSIRADTELVRDGAGSNLLLFGGANCSGVPLSGCTLLSDSWSFDGAWHRLTPGARPSGTSDFPATYDLADRYVLLTGGTNHSGT